MMNYQLDEWTCHPIYGDTAFVVSLFHTVFDTPRRRKAWDVLIPFKIGKAGISFGKYIGRIAKYLPVTTGILMHAVILCLRVKRACGDYLPRQMMHKMVFISIMLAVKFLEDVVYKDRFFAAVAGMGIDEVIRLQMDLLDIVGFSLIPKKEEIDNVLEMFRKDETTLWIPNDISDTDFGLSFLEI